MNNPPDECLAEHKSKLKSARAHSNLDNVHEVCRTIYNLPGINGRKDYSIVSVARNLEALKKGPSYNTLRATAGARFRELIRAWAAFDGADPGKPNRNSTPSSSFDKLLGKIPDHALRSLIRFEMDKGKKALAELNTIKGRTTLAINLRSIDGRSFAQSPAESALALIEPDSGLLDPEREALENALDGKHLFRFGLAENKDGEIVLINGGRVLFSAGFTTGLKKLLGGKP